MYRGMANMDCATTAKFQLLRLVKVVKTTKTLYLSGYFAYLTVKIFTTKNIMAWLIVEIEVK